MKRLRAGRWISATSTMTTEVRSSTARLARASFSSRGESEHLGADGLFRKRISHREHRIYWLNRVISVALMPERPPETVIEPRPGCAGLPHGAGMQRTFSFRTDCGERPAQGCHHSSFWIVVFYLLDVHVTFGFAPAKLSGPARIVTAMVLALAQSGLELV
jgi:hypothetical protein